MSSTAAQKQSIAQVGSWSAFKSPSFRLYFGGQLVSVSGTWMQTVAQQVVVFQLTHSNFALGLTAAAQGLPALILTPFAGVLVERFARRTILIYTQTAMMILAFIMAGLTFAQVLQLWHILALSLGLGIANALDAPARQAFVVEMVGRDSLSSGIALNSIMFNTARILGPALGGFALVAVGAAWCFLLNGLSFLAVILSLILMRVQSIQRISGRIRIFQPLKEGLQYVQVHPAIVSLLLLSAITSVFGLTFATLIPSFAEKILGSGAILLLPKGLDTLFKHAVEVGTSSLLTAQGIGAVLAGLFITRINYGGHRGLYVFTVSFIGPTAVVLMALSGSFASALLLIGIAGFSFITQFVLTNTLIQAEVDEEFRGRVLSLYVLSFFGLSPFGSLIIGVIAQAINARNAIFLYGIVCLVTVGVLLWRSPHVRKLR